MTYSSKKYTGDGVTTDFTVTFDYLDQSHVKVRVGKVFTTEVGSAYKVTWLNSTSIRVDTVIDGNPVQSGVEIEIIRQTPIDVPAVIFGGGASLSSENLNKNSEYLTFALQEATDANEEFTKLYLGSFGEFPVTDNDGDQLQIGAVVYYTPENALYYWTGTEWIIGESTVAAQLFRDEAEAARDAAAAYALSAQEDAAAAAVSAAASATSASEAAASADAAAVSAAASATSASEAAASADAAAASATSAASSAAEIKDGVLERLDVDNGTLFVGAASGRVGIGTSSWRDNSLLRIAEPDNSTVAIELGTTGTNTNRFSRLGFTHYAGDTEEPVAGFNFFADSTRNLVQIGGGSTLLNTATEVRFFTAADNTTTAGTERMRIDSSGNVGIGTKNPTRKLDVAGDVQVVGTGDGAPCLSLTSGETFNNGSNIVPRVPTGGLINIENGQLKIWPDLDGDGDYDADMWAASNMYLAADARIHLRTNIPEIGGAGDNEGRLVIGATLTTNYIQSAKNFSGSVRKDFAIGDYNSTDWWAYFDQSNGGWMGVGTSTPIARLHAADSGATIALFESTGSTTARIGFKSTAQSGGTEVTVGSDSADRLVLRAQSVDHVKLGGGAVQSGSDNGISLGSASFRFSQVYAANGTINTSDAREKQDISELSEAERQVAQEVKRLLIKFRWRDAVSAKGMDARWHFGVIAQDVIAAFENGGLDPMQYGIICYDEWPDEYDDSGALVKEAGNRYGVRYEELLVFVLAAV